MADNVSLTAVFAALVIGGLLFLIFTTILQANRTERGGEQQNIDVIGGGVQDVDTGKGGEQNVDTKADPIDSKVSIDSKSAFKRNVTVLLTGLTDKAQRAYNGKVATVTEFDENRAEEPYEVFLKDQVGNLPRRIRVKQVNLIGACEECHKPGASSVCGKCRHTAYCSVDCQRKDWPKHKYFCAARATDRLAGKDRKWVGRDHPSWERLVGKQRHMMRVFHAHCSVPWPLTWETDAMLETIPCFLTNHPNMKFHIVTPKLPPVPIDGRPQPSGGDFIFMIAEDQKLERHQPTTPGSPAITNYEQVVPMHIPNMNYVVLGEVIFTPVCRALLAHEFSHKTHPGALGRWPDILAVCLCPGSGVEVKPDGSTRHILVAYNMQMMKVIDGTIELKNRIIPRILTIEGYERMLDGPHRFYNEKKTPFYPDTVRYITRKLMLCNDPEIYPKYRSIMDKVLDGITNMETCCGPLETPVTAYDAWYRFRTSGLYRAWDIMQQQQLQSSSVLTEGLKVEGLGRVKVEMEFEEK